MTSSPDSSPHARALSARWWTSGQGWAGVAQWPNPAIVVWMLTVLVRWTGFVDDAALSSKIATLGQGALLVWALDELVRGTNPLRRLLGFVVLAAQLLLIFT